MAKQSTKLLELISEVNRVAEYDIQELTVFLYTDSKQMENFKCQFVIECDTIVMAIINHPAANLVGPGRPRALPPSWGGALQLSPRPPPQNLGKPYMKCFSV